MSLTDLGGTNRGAERSKSRSTNSYQVHFFVIFPRSAGVLPSQKHHLHGTLRYARSGPAWPGIIFFFSFWDLGNLLAKCRKVLVAAGAALALPAAAAVAAAGLRGFGGVPPKKNWGQASYLQWRTERTTLAVRAICHAFCQCARARLVKHGHFCSARLPWPC